MIWNHFRLSVVLGCALALVAPLAVSEELHARVSYEAGGAMVKGTSDSDWSYAPVNTLVLQGDTLWADTGALLEVELSGGSFVRLADRSKADVVSLPPTGVVRGWSGSFYVQRIARSTGDFSFNTPASSVAVDRDTHARVDILESGATTVTVRWGRVTLNTEVGAPVVVSAGQRSYIDPGYLPSLPERFDSGQQDDFDAWSRDRAKVIAVGDEAFPSNYSYRPQSAPIGVYDLPNYGEWVYVDNDYYWRPTVVANYVPYRVGHWSYLPSYGHCWVGDYPFSYVTSHYGRWTYSSGYGWLWTYRDVWSPAWVAAVRVGPNFVWSPLGVNGYPVSYGSMTWDFGTVRFSISASSYCPADSLLFGSAYPYSYPVTYNMCNVPYGNVYVWNFYGDDYHHGDYHHGDDHHNGYPDYRSGRRNAVYPWMEALAQSGIPTRDYSPRRVIRGPDAIGPQATRASERISQLESSVGRANFAAVDRTGGRQVRTATTENGRGARVRDVAVAEARQEEGLTTTQRAVRAQRENEQGGGDVRQSRSVASTDAGTGGNPSTNRRDTRSNRDAESGTGLTSGRGARSVGTDEGTQTNGLSTRSMRSAGEDSSDSNGRGNAPDRSASDASRTPDTSSSAAVDRSTSRGGLRGNDAGTRTPTRDVETPSNRTPGRQIQRSEGGDQTSVRNVQPAERTPSRVLERGSDMPQRNSSTSVERTPSRELSINDRGGQSTPRSVMPRSEPRTTETPSRTSPRSSGRSVNLGGRNSDMADSGQTTRGNRTEAPQPRQTMSQGSDPVQSPRISTRSTQIPRSATIAPPSDSRSIGQQAPSRSIPRSQERNIQVPQRSYEAPQRSIQAPQRSYEAPQRSIQAPQRSYEAPQRSIQAPQTIERSMPQPRSYEMPSRQSAPMQNVQPMQADPSIQMPRQPSRSMGSLDSAGGRGASNRAAGGRQR